MKSALVITLILCLFQAKAQQKLTATSEIVRYEIRPGKADSLREYSSEKRVALVIGNKNYAISPLTNPEHDASDMSDVLRRTGFDVETVVNGTYLEMRDAVKRFAEKIKDGGVGLFYYSGHGVQVDGDNYMIPIDAVLEEKSDVASRCVRVSAVLNYMEASKNRLNILILDACRSNPFKAFTRSGEKGMAREDAPTGSIIAFSTAPGRTASDGTGRNGIYTAKLIKYMNVPGLSIEQVLKNVRREVMEESKNQQVPWENTALVGDFYFTLN
ncbi:caspase family protein [Chryseolinea sp. T2]|uniref:caspase family protein n=1 Tax=Chryseolinea sp. T2 TaxID=3129255 RepID=UPI0030774521